MLNPHRVNHMTNLARTLAVLTAALVLAPAISIAQDEWETEPAPQTPEPEALPPPPPDAQVQAELALAEPRPGERVVSVLLLQLGRELLGFVPMDEQDLLGVRPLYEFDRGATLSR